MFAEPLALARPAHSRQFDAFSPKLGRRVRFFSRGAQRAWLLLEADPDVRRFCERPARIVIDERERVADFWVEFGRRSVFWMVENAAAEDDELAEETDGAEKRAAASTVQVEGRRIRIERISAAALREQATLICNWERIIGYLSANRGFVDERLRHAVLGVLDRPRQLMTIERELAPIDPVLVRAALFSLLQAGRVHAPSLRNAPLSLTTLFRRST